MTPKSAQKSHLVYLLSRQYPSGETTYSPCQICAMSARGGGYCANCLTDELVRQGAERQSVELLKSLFEIRQSISQRIDQVSEKIAAADS